MTGGASGTLASEMAGERDEDTARDPDGADGPSFDDAPTLDGDEGGDGGDDEHEPSIEDAPTAEVVAPTGEDADADAGTGPPVERVPAPEPKKPVIVTASNRQIGPYSLVRKLGEGGFGVVYLAEQTRPVKRRVALKLIKPGMDTEAVVARFEAERQALAVMDHPGVAKVLDGGTTDDGRPFFVMEFVDGTPISAFCDTRKLSLRERVELFVGVCEAVQHAHAKGIVHRDLKPSNILVGEVDGKARPKVIDFGIAKALDQRLTEKTFFTEHGQIIGTPEYMSPEQAGIVGIDIDTRTDVYALGVVLYQLLTGQLPFDPKTLRSAGYVEIQRIIREVDPPRPSFRLSTMALDGPVGAPGDTTQSRVASDRKTDPSRLRRTLREDLDWVVMKCLEKDRTRRYDTPSQLAEELRRYLNNEPVMAGPPSVSYKLGKFVRRHRAGVAGGSVVAASLVIAAVVSTAFGLSEAEARQQEAAARQVAEAERERAERETAVAEAVNAFLNDDLLGAPNPLADGPDVRVIEILSRAGDRVRERFADQPEVRARVLASLGEAYVNIGAPTEAIELLEEAWVSFQALGQRSSPKSLSAGRALTEALWRRDRFDEAMAVIDAVLEAYPEADRGSDDYLAARLERANAVKYEGRLDEAEVLYRDLADAYASLKGDGAADTWWVRYDLALIDVERGKQAGQAGDEEARVRLITSGLEQMERAWEGLRDAAGETDPRTVTAASEVAAQLNRLDLFERAEPFYVRTVAAMRERLGDEHFRTLQAIANFGRLQQKQAKHAEAVKLLDEALAGYREEPGPTAPDTVVITGWLADSLEALGRVDDARALLERSYAECAADPGADRWARRQAGLLAGLAERLGDAGEAARWRGLSESP